MALKHHAGWFLLTKHLSGHCHIGDCLFPPPIDQWVLLSGVFVSSWLGSLLLQVGEWIIKKLPLVKHIYSAAKQVSAAVNPANETTQSFRECVLIRHPRNGEFAFGFITGQTLLQVVLPLTWLQYCARQPTVLIGIC